MKVFRYRLSSVFLLMGLIVTALSFVDGVALVNNAYNEELELNEYSYKSSTELSVGFDSTEATLSDIADELIDEEISIVISDFIVHLDDAGEDVISDVIISSEGTLPYNILNGRLPDNEENCVAVGRKYSDYLFEKNNIKYIKIGGQEYEIVGEIGTPNTDIQDYKIVFGKSILNSELNNVMLGLGGFTLLLGSNERDVSDIASDIIIRLNTIDGVQCDLSQDTVNIVSNEDSMSMMYFAICVFCFISLIIISELWIVSVSRDIAIRKAYGFTDAQLQRLICKDLVKLSLTALCAVYVLQKVMNILLDKQLGIVVEWSVRYVVIVVGGVFLMDFILSGIIINKLKKYPLSKLVY